jgi:hypothetical protein
MFIDELFRLSGLSKLNGARKYEHREKGNSEQVEKRRS